jgi:hypothetical protein
MGFIQWLQDLGRDADPAKVGFQAQLLYLVVCAAMPVVIGAVVGFGLRSIERIFGVELGKGGH